MIATMKKYRPCLGTVFLVLSWAIFFSACGGSGPTCAQATSVEITKPLFCIHAVTVSDGVDLYARTSTAGAVFAVKLSGFTLQNMTSSEGATPVKQIEQTGDTLLTHLVKVDTSAAWSYSYSYQYLFGKLAATHDSTYAYRIPWTTSEAHSVIQGYTGAFSHSDAGLEEALDFGMAEGTATLAARGGLVVEVEESYSGGGTDTALKTQANKVAILHSDGTGGLYLHFKKDGVSVTEGQTVAKGDLIAYSGNTGYSTTPHLHFQVQRPLSTWVLDTVATTFTAQSGTGLTLSLGSSYTAID